MQTPKGEINDKVMKLTEDEELLQKMSTATSPEDAYNMVKDRLDGMSFEEFTASMTVAKACVSGMENQELSDEDLDMVAGGKGSSTPSQSTINTLVTLNSGIQNLMSGNYFGAIKDLISLF